MFDRSHCMRSQTYGTVSASATVPVAMHCPTRYEAQAALAMLSTSTLFPGRIATVGNTRVSIEDIELIRSNIVGGSRLSDYSFRRNESYENECIIDGWDCSLGTRSFHRVLDLSNGHRYKITGRFVTSGLTGAWTSDEYQIISLPTESEAKYALLSWLLGKEHREIALLPGADMLLRRQAITILDLDACSDPATVIISSNINNIQYSDSWIILAEDLTFVKRIRLPSTIHLFILGRFELGTNGDWKAVPCKLAERLPVAR
jgi:hypothetical protein